MQMWTELALSARNGNRQDLEALVDLSYGPTRRLCASLVDDQSADDLVQETFLRMAKGIRRFRGESSAQTWIFSIAYHVCASELRVRTRNRDRLQSASDDELSNITVISSVADDVVLNDLLHHLDPERRAAFILTQLYGMSYDEAAAICRCAPGTVGSRVARARDDLIRMLNVDERQEPTVRAARPPSDRPEDSNLA
jgi:RNA polymerase sigma-70 factor, ECF subfamily